MMINTDKQITHNIFDQNRLGANAAIAFNKQITLALSYFDFYQSTNIAASLLNRKMYHLSLILYFENKKKRAISPPFTNKKYRLQLIVSCLLRIEIPPFIGPIGCTKRSLIIYTFEKTVLKFNI